MARRERPRHALLAAGYRAFEPNNQHFLESRALTPGLSPAAQNLSRAREQADNVRVPRNSLPAGPPIAPLAESAWGTRYQNLLPDGGSLRSPTPIRRLALPDWRCEGTDSARWLTR